MAVEVSSPPEVGGKAEPVAAVTDCYLSIKEVIVLLGFSPNSGRVRQFIREGRLKQTIKATRELIRVDHLLEFAEARRSIIPGLPPVYYHPGNDSWKGHVSFQDRTCPVHHLPGNWMSAEEAAAHLDRPSRNVRDECIEGTLPSERIGDRWLIPFNIVSRRRKKS